MAGLKVIRLQSENFKRVKAIDISPGPDGMVTIRGKNGQGKSSVLDSLFAAMAGKDAAPPMPVRKGEERAVIKVALGSGDDTRITVLRTFDADGTTSLKVETPDGAKYSSPQAMLDGLVGALSFDPLEFKDMPAKAQANELRRLVPLSVNLDELAAADKADFDRRRDINRDVAANKARIEAIPDIEGLPDVAPDRSEIMAQLAKAGETNAEIERRADRREQANERLAVMDSELIAAEEGLKRMMAEIESRKTERAELAKQIETAEPLPAPIDTEALRAAHADAERIAALCAQRDNRTYLVKEADGQQAEADKLTRAMEDRKTLRAKAMAEAKMPVPGMTLNETADMVLLDGVPFEQASSAQQLRVSTTLAMQANPKLRVLRIRQGSLLDDEGLQLLAEMAKAGDFQIWLEMVGDGGQGIIMEDGSIRGAAEPESLADEGPKRRKKEPAVESTPGIEAEQQAGDLVVTDVPATQDESNPDPETGNQDDSAPFAEDEPFVTEETPVEEGRLV